MGIKIKIVKGGFARFICPACDETHQVGIDSPTTVIWDYNDDTSLPTFSPSILVRGIIPPTDKELDEGTFVRKPRVCHSFIENGMIRYLDDCTHKLSGQTVELPDFKEAK